MSGHSVETLTFEQHFPTGRELLSAFSRSSAKIYLYLHDPVNEAAVENDNIMATAARNGQMNPSAAVEVGPPELASTPENVEVEEPILFQQEDPTGDKIKIQFLHFENN